MNRFTAALLLAPLTAIAAPAELSKQTVSADFRQTDVQQLPEAVTVINSEQINARSADHLEQVLSFAPNVNFASGSSRARFFQIRGIGERSQFIDPVNPSVGLIIDGIDMTGLGAAATLFDVQQVEVLRGPQGTRFGANALGGLINITSTDPSAETQGYLSAKAGNYNTYGAGGAVSGRINRKTTGRIAVHHLGSNGYMKNDYLKRDDTQDLNETVVRTKVLWQPTTDVEVKLTYLFANSDNGYDAFTLDNSRHSLADEPGQDMQRTNGWALSYKNILNSKVTFESTLSGSHSKAIYSFDEDWVHTDLDPNTYSYFDQYNRTFSRGAADIRWLSGVDGRLFNDSTDWVFGLYSMSRSEELERKRRKETLWSQYDNNLKVNATSLYGELSTQFNSANRLIYGLRLENWQNDFDASDAVTANTKEWLLGGKVTFEHLLASNQLSYATFARGYKAGGVNSDDEVNETNRSFDTEYNNTYELGLKSQWLDNALQTRVAAFYIQRYDQQVKSSYVIPGTPPSFQDYLANAAKGRNYGLELESQWQLTEKLLWDFSYGYLNTEFLDYIREENVFDDDWNVIGSKTIDKSGRAQAHAPKHSASTALTYHFIEALALRLETEAKDTFYFSDSHDEMAPGYVLYHARLSFTQPSYELALSGRNLSNVDTQTRGFGGFGNDPRDGWAEHKYVQLGEPRLVMLEGKFRF